MCLKKLFSNSCFQSALFILLWSVSGLANSLQAWAAPAGLGGTPKSLEEVSSQAAKISGKIPDELKEIAIVEEGHIGKKVSISDLAFKDEDGNDIRLSKYFESGKPVLFTPVYYGCPMLCGMLLKGVLESIQELEASNKNSGWFVGGNFEIVTFSIDPKETPELARQKKASFIGALGRPEAAQGWHFLTGTEDQIRKLTSEIGFGYRWDPKEKQYAHSAAVIALTPNGEISRYLHGIKFQNKDLKLALLEASKGKIGTIVEQILLFCYRYDPQTRKYSVYLTKLMQVGCGATVLIFGGYLGLFWRRQRRVEESEFHPASQRKGA